MEYTKTRFGECGSCGYPLSDEDAAAPAWDDDEAWAEESRRHAVDCEWVRTRAGTAA